MREILFRGKRIDNDEWVYGSFCMDAIEQKNGPCGLDGFIRLYDFDKDKTQMYEVDRETIGQFTGLTDKNGKRIFEGDIVRFSERRLSGVDISVVEQVAFEEGGFCTHSYFLNNWLRIGNTNLEGIEIIGNIHDNPQLLEDSE